MVNAMVAGVLSKLFSIFLLKKKKAKNGTEAFLVENIFSFYCLWQEFCETPWHIVARHGVLTHTDVALFHQGKPCTKL